MTKGTKTGGFGTQNRHSFINGKRAWRAPVAAELSGVSYRQIDYWCRTELLKPSLHEAGGSGSVRYYSERDIQILKLIKQMLSQGIGLGTIRIVMDQIEAMNLRVGDFVCIIDSHVIVSSGAIQLDAHDFDVALIFRVKAVVSGCRKCGWIETNTPAADMEDAEYAAFRAHVGHLEAEDHGYA